MGTPLRGHKIEIRGKTKKEKGRRIMAQKGINIPENWHQNLDGSYDVAGMVYISRKYVSNGKLRIKFGKVSDRFYCSSVGLTSLEGCPKEVGGSFDCEGNKLKTLEGAPKEVGKSFYCSYNQLTSLAGAPDIIKGSFDCSHNLLTTLRGAPKYVFGDFSCKYNLLSSLEGSPLDIGRNFFCTNNKLVTLTGAPKSVKGSFIVDSNPLRDLNGSPEVGGKLSIKNTDYYKLQEGLTIKAQELPSLYQRHIDQDIKIQRIDWSGFTRSLYKYARWIPRDLYIEHLNLNFKQQKELYAIMISRV